MPSCGPSASSSPESRGVSPGVGGGRAHPMRPPPPGEREARAVERIDDPREADARVLEHLASLGCDPAEPREVRHFFYAEDWVDAQTVADTLAGGGWATRVDDWGEAGPLVRRDLPPADSRLLD